MTDIYDLLYRLGVTANYNGFFHTAYAVSLCAEQPERLLLVTKWLYPEVAKQYKTNWKAVERNLRRVVCTAWHENRPLLEQLAHRPLSQKPRTAQFLAILTASLDTDPLTICGPSEPSVLSGEDDVKGTMNRLICENRGETAATKNAVPPSGFQVGNDENPALTAV